MTFTVTPQDTRPCIDLTRPLTREGLLLSIEAEQQIMANRELHASRAQRSLAELLVCDGGFDYTPGVGLHQPVDPKLAHLPKPPYVGAACLCRSCDPDWRDRNGRALSHRPVRS